MGATTLNIATFSIMTLILTIRITTLTIMPLHGECCYYECRIFAVIPTVVRLNVNILSSAKMNVEAPIF